MVNIRVADVAPAPGGRYRADGPYSGEEFRDDVLVPALRQAGELGDVVIVRLDGTAGYSASFLEEAFGGLVRQGIIEKSDVGKLLTIDSGQSVYDYFRDMALRFIKRANKTEPAAA